MRIPVISLAIATVTGISAYQQLTKADRSTASLVWGVVFAAISLNNATRVVHAVTAPRQMGYPQLPPASENNRPRTSRYVTPFPPPPATFVYREHVLSPGGRPLSPPQRALLR